MMAMNTWVPIATTVGAACLVLLIKEVRSVKLNLVIVNTTLKFLTENGILKAQSDLAERVSRLEGRRESDDQRPKLGE